MKKTTILILINVCVLVSLILYIFIDLINAFNVIDAGKLESPADLKTESVNCINLSTNDYESDFLFLWDVISKASPIIEDYKDNLNYDFISNYERYYDEISSSNSNFEFYCRIKSVLNDIPSFHTYFFNEDKDDYFYSNCYLSDVIRTNKKLKSYQDLWKEYGSDCVNTIIEQNKAIVFCYVDGEYIFSDYFSDNNQFSGCVMTGIDNDSVENFVKSTLSAFKLRYDFKKECFYRPYIVLNMNSGIKHKILLKDETGEEYIKDVYFSLEFEFSKNQIEAKPGDENNYKSYKISSINENITYVRIDDFANNEGRALWKQLKDNCFIENHCVILDLRNNPGGYIEYALANIVPVLFNGELVVQNTEWLYKSKYVNELYNAFSVQGIGNRIKYELSKSEKNFDYSEYSNGFLERSSENKYHGLNSFSSKVYILVSDGTGSAADHFVSDVMKYPETTVVGVNTAGEKFGGQAVKCLPKSNLVFSFFPEIYYNEDGKNNSLYGTFPDEYATISLNDFKLREAMLKNGKDPYSMENRMIWDTALKRTMDIIKEKQ